MNNNITKKLMYEVWDTTYDNIVEETNFDLWLMVRLRLWDFIETYSLSTRNIIIHEIDNII